MITIYCLLKGDIMKKKYINIIGIFVLVATLFLTIGYSAFNDSLTIASSNAKVRIYDDINIRWYISNINEIRFKCG